MPDISQNDFLGLREIDLFGLLYDYKKIISTGISEPFLKNLKNTFGRYGLKYDVLDESFDYQGRGKIYLIAKKKRYLERTKKAYKSRQFDLVGKYLGYPECCVRFYYKKFLKAPSSSDNLLRNIYHNSNNFSWRLNNILNFEGRIKGRNTPKEFTSFVQKTSSISLISHSPCSYNCKESLKIANLNQRYLFFHNRAHLNDYAILKKPILYLDDFHFIIFEGNSGEDFIRYRKLLVYLGLEQSKDYFLKGDSLKIDNNSALIFKDEREVAKKSYDKKILILPFDRLIGSYAKEKITLSFLA
mgnify:CR=1 FL=1